MACPVAPGSLQHRCAASSMSHCRCELGLFSAADPRRRCGPRPPPVSQGAPLLLENLPMELDAVLDPVLAKRTIKRGRALVMKVGDTEVDYDPGFRWAARGGGMRIPRQTAAIINSQKMRMRGNAGCIGLAGTRSDPTSCPPRIAPLTGSTSRQSCPTPTTSPRSRRSAPSSTSASQRRCGQGCRTGPASVALGLQGRAARTPAADVPPRAACDRAPPLPPPPAPSRAWRTSCWRWWSTTSASTCRSRRPRWCRSWVSTPSPSRSSKTACWPASPTPRHARRHWRKGLLPLHYLGRVACLH